MPALQRARGRVGPVGPGHAGPSPTPTAGGASPGQKVWTSYAQFARYGLCLARTEAGHDRAPRACRCWWWTWQAPGVDIRPLVQITGEAEFNEVFLDDVFVPADHLVGAAGQGWAVASTTLAHERGTNFPFKEEVVHEGYLTGCSPRRLATAPSTIPTWPTRWSTPTSRWWCCAPTTGARCRSWRAGEEPGPESSWVKLTWSDMTQELSQAALAVQGPAAPAVGAVAAAVVVVARRPASPAAPRRCSAT